MNRLKRCIAMLLGTAMVMVGGVSPALAASSNVEFVGGAAGFVLLPDNDLWDGMKNLMPGDVVTESIGIGNRSSVACDLYLTMGGAVESTRLVEQLELRIALVTAQGKETELYSGSAAGNGNGIHLGRYSPGSGATLTATLSVPVTLGNAYQHISDSVVWRFAATEYHPPVDNDDDDDDDDGSTVVIKTPAIVKVGASGLLPETGAHTKL